MAAHVIDTNVLVAALRSSSGASRQLLLAVLNGRLEIVVSVPLLLEYESVLKRSEQLEAMRLAIEDIDAVLGDLIAVAREVGLMYRWRPNIKDPKDDMVLETAINGGAKTIITFNAQHFVAAGKRFGIRIMQPTEILKVLRRSGYADKQFCVAIAAVTVEGSTPRGTERGRRTQSVDQRRRGREALDFACGKAIQKTCGSGGSTEDTRSA